MNEELEKGEASLEVREQCMAFISPVSSSSLGMSSRSNQPGILHIFSVMKCLSHCYLFLFDFNFGGL